MDKGERDRFFKIGAASSLGKRGKFSKGALYGKEHEPYG
jgi:hypothetical protein